MSVYISKDNLEKVDQVKAIIDTDFKYHYTHQQLAQKVNANETKLRRTFKLINNMTITAYWSMVRIEKAKELLSNTTLPVQTIAGSVGYNYRSFTRQFKRYTELSPFNWRRIHSNNNN